MAVCRTGSRLHVGLFDLGRATARAYGGAGFMLASPSTEVRAQRAPHWEIAYPPEVDDRTQADLRAVVASLKSLSDGRAAAIEITTTARQHVGFGSKTMLLLAVAQAVNAELALGLDTAHMQRLTGRGGTSGIGVNGFFSGGFIVDAGHPATSVVELAPSSITKPAAVPPVTVRHVIPSHWRFHIILPSGVTYCGARESRFFSSSTPVPSEEVFRTIAYATHELAPAVQAADLRALASALRNLHSVGFKLRELLGQTEAVRSLIRALQALELPVGLSSMGPLVYAVTGPEESAGEAVRSVAKSADSEFLCTALGQNTGASLTA